MSRGLGKVEQKIMEFLAMGVMRVDINGLIGKNTKTGVFIPKRVSIKELLHHTKKHYQSVTRAVRSLEKKGIIETSITKLKYIKNNKSLDPTNKKEIIQQLELDKRSWCKTVHLSEYAIGELKKSPNVDKYIKKLQGLKYKNYK